METNVEGYNGMCWRNGTDMMTWESLEVIPKMKARLLELGFADEAKEVEEIEEKMIEFINIFDDKSDKMRNIWSAVEKEYSSDASTEDIEKAVSSYRKNEGKSNVRRIRLEVTGLCWDGTYNSMDEINRVFPDIETTYLSADKANNYVSTWCIDIDDEEVEITEGTWFFKNSKDKVQITGDL